MLSNLALMWGASSITAQACMYHGVDIPEDPSAELGHSIWVVVKIMVPFGVPIIIRHLLFRVPTRDHNFDNHPYVDNNLD